MVLLSLIVIKENINLVSNFSSLMCCKDKVEEEDVYSVFLSSMNILISKKIWAHTNHLSS